MGSKFAAQLILVASFTVVFQAHAVVSDLAAESCPTALTVVPSEDKPVGFVSDRIVKQFAFDSPVLLTETHLRSLGVVLGEMGLSDVFDASGGPKTLLTSAQKKRAIGFLKNPEAQAEVAERVWGELENAYQLRTPMLSPAEILRLADKSAYTDSSQFVAARNALIVAIPERRQIVELLRLSSPLAVRLALQNRTRRQEVLTLTREAAFGLGAFAFTKIAATSLSLLTLSDPTAMPLHLAAFAAVVTATSYFVRDHLPPPIAMRYLRLQNNVVLRAKGLRGKDGENTLFVTSAFSQRFDDNKWRPEVAAIAPYQPRLEIGDDAETVNALLRFGADLQNLAVANNDYMIKVVEHWAVKTTNIGEPVMALSAFFQANTKDTPKVPSNLREKLAIYQNDLADTHTRLTAVQRYFTALAGKVDTYRDFLESFKDKNETRLGAASINSIERRLIALNQTRQAIDLFNHTTQKHMQNLSDENDTISAALTGIAALRNAGTLRAEQADALFQLMKIVSDRNAQFKIPSGGTK